MSILEKLIGSFGGCNAARNINWSKHQRITLLQMCACALERSFYCQIVLYYCHKYLSWYPRPYSGTHSFRCKQTKTLDYCSCFPYWHSVWKGSSHTNKDSLNLAVTEWSHHMRSSCLQSGNLSHWSKQYLSAGCVFSSDSAITLSPHGDRSESHFHKPWQWSWPCAVRFFLSAVLECRVKTAPLQGLILFDFIFYMTLHRLNQKYVPSLVHISRDV